MIYFKHILPIKVLFKKLSFSVTSNNLPVYLFAEREKLRSSSILKLGFISLLSSVLLYNLCDQLVLSHFERVLLKSAVLNEIVNFTKWFYFLFFCLINFVKHVLRSLIGKHGFVLVERRNVFNHHFALYWAKNIDPYSTSFFKDKFLKKSSIVPLCLSLKTSSNGVFAENFSLLRLFNRLVNILITISFAIISFN